MKYLASLAALAFCLFLGCSKETAPKAENPPTQTTLKMGVLDVADGAKMVFDLGRGKTCTITPTFQKEGTVLLEMMVEQNGKVLSRPRILTPFDIEVSIFDGTTAVEFTPRKKS